MELFRIEYSGEDFNEYVQLSAKSKKTGKPRMMKVNSQDLYSGINHHLRSKIVREVKKHLYTKGIKDCPVITNYPIKLDIEVHYPLSDWDMGNKLYMWRKCFEDALCGNVEFYKIPPLPGKIRNTYKPMRDKYPAKLEDDSVRFLTEYGEKYIEVAKIEDRRLVFIISTV